MYSQSTNDVYPTALKIADIRLVTNLGEVIAKHHRTFQKRLGDFVGILKLGHAEMQGAVPVTLGQKYGAYTEVVARNTIGVGIEEGKFRS